MVIGLIPARKGSKRIPGKNMALLGGKPLLQISIETATEAGIFKEIVVSSDWDECLELASGLGVTPLLRPAALCLDTSHDYEWVSHAMEGREADAFVILRPTSPFRTAETIQRAWREFQEGQLCDSQRAVEPVTQHPLKSWIIDNAYMMPFLKMMDGGIPSFDKPSQSLWPLCCQNGCIHIAWTSTLENYGNVSGEIIRPFFTTGNEGVDINTKTDLIFAEWLMGRKA